MSCTRTRPPVNISANNVRGSCDLKCEFAFSYGTSATMLVNRGDYLSMTHDAASTPPVHFNAAAYQATHVRLYAPSLHVFSDTRADAELIVVHEPVGGGRPLLVCVPVSGRALRGPGGDLLHKLIVAASAGAPTEGERTATNVPDFSLNTIVPRRPFFTYTDVEPYAPCSQKVNCIVFPMANAVEVGVEDLTILKKIVSTTETPGALIKKSTVHVFYNERGPTIGDGGDDVYIDCQPVGRSEDVVPKRVDPGLGPTLDAYMAEFFKNPASSPGLLIMLLIALVAIIIWSVQSGIDWVGAGGATKAFLSKSQHQTVPTVVPHAT